MAPAAKWIVVTEDYDALRELWTMVLTRAGYRVLGARNGREALDLMRTVVPDLVTLDLRMPDMGGPAFLKVLADSPVLGRIPVLIVSGFLEDEAPGTSLGLNIVGRLSKPVRPADLVAAVQAALKSSGPPHVGMPMPAPR
jgi:CheY-like chemotaxis protein